MIELEWVVYLAFFVVRGNRGSSFVNGFGGEGACVSFGVFRYVFFLFCDMSWSIVVIKS